jgi:hypothetical protein
VHREAPAVHGLAPRLEQQAAGAAQHLAHPQRPGAGYQGQVGQQRRTSPAASAGTGCGEGGVASHGMCQPQLSTSLLPPPGLLLGAQPPEEPSEMDGRDPGDWEMEGGKCA